MTRSKEDVLVHYDETSGELVFFTVPTNATHLIRSAAFGGIRPEVAELQSLPPAEAMRRVGGTVLGLLDLSSQTKLGITSMIND
jgi:hypothetical protein